MATHYETLGVEPRATSKEIRKAYLRRARALHPDRQQGRSTADARRAEEAMRQVNVAWNVLSDSKKRSEYDQRIASRTASRQSSSAQPRPQRPTPQSRPTPTNAHRRPTTSQPADSGPATRSFDDEPGDGSVSVWASLPVLIFIGIALGLLLVTAFGGSDSSIDNRELVPELDSSMREEACFVFRVDGSIQQESCASGRAEAEVVAVVPDPGNCPSNTENTVQGNVVLCYVPLVAGSSVQAGS